MPTSLTELWEEQDHFKAAIAAKLRGLLDTPQTRNLDRCGREKMFRHCRGCGDVAQFQYHCDLKWCPRCQHRITARRLRVLREWVKMIGQPKHIVTTQRNFDHLTHRRLRLHTRALAQLRRQKVFKLVRGGCVSVEITNEDRGWHLHAHWLVDSRWVDAGELATTWARVIGQDDRAIVRVKDVRGSDYVSEVSKYVCKGSEIAAWTPEEINEFVQAVRGHRFFFQFGTLFKLARKIRAALLLEKETAVCDCGCSRFVWCDETTEVVREICPRRRR